LKIFWSFKDVPELADLSRSERRRVDRACHGETFKSRLCLAALGVCVLCCWLGILLGIGLLWLSGCSPGIYLAVGGVIGSAIGGGIGGLIYGQIVTDYLRPFYADHIKTKL
jgi:hypothetical protein